MKRTKNSKKKFNLRNRIKEVADTPTGKKLIKQKTYINQPYNDH